MEINDRLELADPAQTAHLLEGFIRDKVEGAGKDGCILGMSGGIDSVLTAALAVNALGKDRVHTLFLPERDSSPQSAEDAKMVVDWLGISLKEISLTPLLDVIGSYGLEPSFSVLPRNLQEKLVSREYHLHGTTSESTFLRTLKGGGGDSILQRHIAYYSIKHRLRMVLLFYYAEMNNRMVLGTCNKSEKMTGFFIKYGDSASDIDVLADLYKTQVRQLARHLGVPERILSKAPSPDLLPGLTDEQAIRVPYEQLDRVLAGLEAGMEPEALSEAAVVSLETVRYIQQLKELSAPMRTLPPHLSLHPPRITFVPGEAVEKAD